MTISGVAFIIGAICIFGGGLAFCHYHESKSFVDYDKGPERISLVVLIIGIVIVSISLKGILF